MFTKYSMTGTGLLVLGLVWFGQWIGLVDFNETQATHIIESAINIMAFVFVVYGQIRRKDLKFGLLKK